MRATWIFVSLIAVSTGCQKEPTSRGYFKTLGPVASARFGLIRDLRGPLDKIPALTKDTVEQVTPVPLLPTTGELATADFNTLIVHKEDMQPVNADKPALFYRLNIRTWDFWETSQALEFGGMIAQSWDTPVAADVKRGLELLAEVRYALVLRVVGYVEPKTLSGTAFTGGGIASEAHLFDVGTQKHLGGFRFVNITDAKIGYTVVEGDGPNYDKMSRAVQDNLKVGYRKAFLKGMEQKMPDVKGLDY